MSISAFQGTKAERYGSTINVKRYWSSRLFLDVVQNVNLILFQKHSFPDCNTSILLKYFFNFWKLNDLVTGCCTSRLFVKGSHFCCMKTLPISNVIIYVFTGDVRGSENSPKCPVMCQNGFCTSHRGDSFCNVLPSYLGQSQDQTLIWRVETSGGLPMGCGMD